MMRSGGTFARGREGVGREDARRGAGREPGRGLAPGPGSSGAAAQRHERALETQRHQPREPGAPAGSVPGKLLVAATASGAPRGRSARSGVRDIHLLALHAGGARGVAQPVPRLGFAGAASALEQRVRLDRVCAVHARLRGPLAQGAPAAPSASATRRRPAELRQVRTRRSRSTRQAREGLADSVLRVRAVPALDEGPRRPLPEAGTLGAVAQRCARCGLRGGLDGDPHRAAAARADRGANLCFPFCITPFHWEHHLVPGIPWYRLPRFRRAIQDRIPESRRDWIYTPGRSLLHEVLLP
jgi:hypothetical protein